MPADQRNFAYSDYLSDDATTYCLKADANMVATAALGGVTPCTSGIAYGRSSARRQPRKAIYRDGTTFRTVTTPVFTPTDFAALTVGTDTITVHVPGNTATVTYTLVKKVAEKVPSIVIGRTDADHA